MNLEKRNVGLLIKFTSTEKKKLLVLTRDSGFTDVSKFVRYKIFYENPIFELTFLSKIEHYLLKKQYWRATKFLKSIRDGRDRKIL